MIVVCDTSPILYLVAIGQIEILPALFGAVFVPTAVADKLHRDATPEVVRNWLTQEPPWLQIRSAKRIDETIPLGRGESEAISLAAEMHASLLLVDDRLARRHAQQRGLAVAGTRRSPRSSGGKGLARFADGFHPATRDKFSRLRTDSLARLSSRRRASTQ